MKLMHPTVFGLGLFSVIISELGIMVPRLSSLFTVMLPTGNDAVAGVFLGGMLMVSSLFIYFCQRGIKLSFGLLGMILLLLAGMGLFYPTYFGAFQYDVSPANLFVLSILGVSYLLASLELELLPVIRPARQLHVRLGHASLSRLEADILSKLQARRRARLTSPKQNLIQA